MGAVSAVQGEQSNIREEGEDPSYLYVFGGFTDPDSIVVDSKLFQLNIKTKTWDFLGEEGSGISPWPSHRWGFDMIPLGNFSGFLLLGGLSNSTFSPHVNYDDVWMYNAEWNEWKLLRDNNDTSFGPPNNVWYELNAVAHQNGMAIVEEVHGNVWYFDTYTAKWEQLYKSPLLPSQTSGEAGGTVCVRGRCDVILTIDDYLNVWTFVVNSRIWTLVLDNSTSPIPENRYQFLLAANEPSCNEFFDVIFFGGSLDPNPGDQLNDLWLLSPVPGSIAWEWKQLKQVPPIPPAREHSCWPLEPKAERMMYGGYGSIDLNDTWALRWARN